MKLVCLVTSLFLLSYIAPCKACAQSNTLKLVFIRHAEKADDGDNLSCKGLNRSLQLPAVLFKKFGKPTNIYIPKIVTGEATTHARMFQTISPFIIKYQMTVNSAYGYDNYKGIGGALLQEKGTVLIVWEHKSIAPILAYLGIANPPKWQSDDFDSILIVTFVRGKATLTHDSEGLNPLNNCAF